MEYSTNTTNVMELDKSNARTLSTDTFYQDDTFHTLLLQITVPIVFSVIVVLGISGNLLVMYVIQSRDYLHTSTHMLLFSLAVADVYFLLICGSFTALHYALTAWPFGDLMCRVIQYFLYVTAYVTVYTLVAVSFIRYVHVVCGSRATFLKRKVTIVALIILIWLLFLLCKIPILLVHSVSSDPDTNRSECIIIGYTEGQKLFATFFVFAYAVPLFIISVLYILLVCHVNKRRTEMIQMSPMSRRNYRVTRVVTRVVVMFAVCWLPIHVHLLIAYYGTLPQSPYYKVLLLCFHLLTFLNSALNPFIYNFCSSDFRRAFREVVCCFKPAVSPNVDL